jgi:hypothetical protein
MNSVQTNVCLTTPNENPRKLEYPFDQVSFGLGSLPVEEIDVFAQRTFQDLIKAQLAQKLDYFLAIGLVENNVVRYYDGFSFVRYWQNSEQVVDPLSRQKIIDFAIYRLNGLDDPQSPFTYFCSRQNFNLKRSFYLTHIQAHSEKDLNKKYAVAFHDIAMNYLKGTTDFEKNESQAYFWIKRAAKQYLDPDDLCLTAYFIQKGWGTKAPLKKAFSYMQMAIQHTKDPKHYYLFATYFEQGIGTDVDLEQAYYWYQKALENGYEKAKINVSSLAELGVISKTSNYAPECWQSCGLIKG